MAPIILPVRAENYHFWQMFFIFPLFVLIWVFVAVLFHVLGRASRKGGSLKRTLAVFGFSLAGPATLLWAPQTVIAVFYGLGMGQQEMVDILSEPGWAQILYLAVHWLAFALGLRPLLCGGVCVPRRSLGGRACFFGVLAGSIFAAAAIIFLR